MRSFLILLVLACFFISCDKERKNEVDVSHIPITIDISRFDEDFYNSTSETLVETKQKYPMFFPHHIDSIWVNKINNKTMKLLNYIFIRKALVLSQGH